MKYGVLFSLLSFLLACYSVTSGGWFLLMLWPVFSVGIVGLAYLTLGHRVFGKCPDGSLHCASVVILLPYLLYVWGVWHLIRIVSREPAYSTLADGILIGRRLLSSELPAGIRTVVDLTSEFPESSALRSVPNYIAAPMLDGSVLAPQSLVAIASRIVTSETPVYIHCAQGHGRTGLIAALLLIARGDADDPDAAMALIRSSRPLMGLNNVQRSALMDASLLIQPGAV